ncbi:unnamed protein product, partial [Ectocarpus sp. 4 AP-2014]
RAEGDQGTDIHVHHRRRRGSTPRCPITVPTMVSLGSRRWSSNLLGGTAKHAYLRLCTRAMRQVEMMRNEAASSDLLLALLGPVELYSATHPWPCASMRRRHARSRMGM